MTMLFILSSVWMGLVAGMRIMLGEKFIALLNVEDAIPLLIRLNLGLKLIGIMNQKKWKPRGKLIPRPVVAAPVTSVTKKSSS